MIAHGREVTGSGLFEGLIFPASQPNVAKIYFWTDGEVRDPDGGFNLPTATNQQMTAEIKRWRPRLRGLNGKTVIVIGGGRGAQTEDAAIKAERLFKAVIEGDGGHVIWTRTLDQIQL